MPLPLPTLDNRTWVELIEESRALIPRYAPGWTDHNVHDPGVTLIELFAWLTEMQLFRLDRISPATMRAFLRAVGVEQLPAGVASTVVAMRSPLGPTPVKLPAGVQFTDIDATVVFESSVELQVSAAWIDLAPTSATPRTRLITDVAGVRTDRTADNAALVAFQPFGPDPAIDSALHFGFDVLPVGRDEELSLYVWTDSWPTDASTRQRIEAECTAANCSADADCQQHYSARTTWEYLSGVGTWSPMHVVADETRALSMSGQVRLAGPERHGPGSDGRFWIRCRLAVGGYDCPPRVQSVAINAVPVSHAAAVTTPELLGWSDGRAAQMYVIGKQPIVEGSTRLRVQVPGGPEDDTWTEIAEWDRSGPDDPHFRVEPLAGTITFGDGRLGRVPPSGASVTALTFKVGGTLAGNVIAGHVSRRLFDAGSGLVVVQPFAASGGTDAETLNQAHGRALNSLDKPTRAITAGDFAALALETPGVPVGRAQALPGYHPSYPCLHAPGVVTVIVLPTCGKPPSPGPEFIERVRRYLERRRPLTTDLHVVGPCYTQVKITAVLHVASVAANRELTQKAQQVLDDFFDPLHGGPDRTGWPMGRDVLETELLALLNNLPGVVYVDDLGISTGNPDSRPCCGSLSICPTALVDSQPHAITIAEIHP